MKVIVVESGDYEARDIDLIAIDAKAAIAAIKKMFEPPYLVTWTERADGLIGDFSYVKGLSTAHRSVFTFTEYDVAE
jgi:hypothetical protein